MEFANVESLTMTILRSRLVVYEFIPLQEVGFKKANIRSYLKWGLIDLMIYILWMSEFEWI